MTQQLASRPVRLTTALALLSTGLLSGAFGYGAVNLVTTFNAVPLDIRLTFHAALMKMNGPVIQSTMAVAALSALALAVLGRHRLRLLAGVAAGLVVTSFLVTRFGNVPINGQIKLWAVGTPPADHAEILQRWEVFNVVRTLSALVAFAIVIWIAVTATRHTARHVAERAA